MIPQLLPKIKRKKGIFLNLAAFPDQLIREGRFCCWRYEDRNGHRTKVPYQPLTGECARSNDPSSFTDYLTASAASHHYDGIGIGIFNGVCTIDLDECIDADGNYTPIAADVIARMHSYTELSPSGRGVHILFRAEGFQYDSQRFYIMNRTNHMEIYVAGATNKYVTITGKPCASYDFGERSTELQEVLERYMKRPDVTSRTSSRNAINANNPDLTTDELLKKAFASRNGDAFRRLWNGDTTGYPSASEAEFALCAKLAFWTGRDAARMDAMFRQSGLMRDKWDRPQAGATYGTITINRAIDCCTNVYTPRGSRIASAPMSAPESVSPPEPQFQPLIPLTPQYSELPTFPVAALPSVMRDYVEAVSEHSQTSPDMAAVIALGVLAVCLQGKFITEGTPGYYEPLNLYVVLIAAPGERKSGVMRDMTKYLYEYEREVNEERKAEIRRNKMEREALEMQLAELKKKAAAKADWTLDAQTCHLQQQLDELPVVKPLRFIADDCSSEALTSLIVNNGGVFSVISTEGGVFDIMAGRYSNRANIDVWLKGHCGDPIYVDRMTREAECVPHPALTTILAIQPSVLDEIMSNTTMTGRGLIARFLYSSPPSRIGSRVFSSKPIDPEISKAYRDMIFRLMALPMPEEAQPLMLSADAAEIMAAYFKQHEQYLTGEGQAISDWASKYIGAVLRISGLLHAADMTESGCPIITDDTIRRAICIGQYFLAHSSYAYSMMGTDLSIQKAKFVLAKLKKKGAPTMKRSEVFQMCRGKFFKKTEEIFPTLEMLADHGYIRMEEPEHYLVGRPPDTRIIVNPKACG